MLSAILAGASLLGPLLSKAGGGAASERGNQNDFLLRQNQQQQQGYQFDMQALLQALQQNERGKMDRAQMGIQAPQARMKQALLGSLLQNAKTARYTPPPGVRMGTVSGGLDLDTLINAMARKAGGTMQTQATQALETGSDVPAYEDATARLQKSPTPGAYKGAGGLESILSGGGMLASLIGGLGAMKGGRKPDPGGAWA